MLASCSVLLGTLVAAHLSYAQQQCLPAISIDKKPQVFIMSDISNEPDDTMSFIRLLLHSDQYNITDMVSNRPAATLITRSATDSFFAGRRYINVAELDRLS